MFRYKSADDYWTVTDTTFGTGATNWWKLYNQIGQYGMLSVGAILTITQLLSMFGIAAEVNVMLWGYATMLVGPLLGAAISGIAMWGYDQAYRLCNADSSTNADACTMMGEMMKKEHMMMKAKELGIEMDKESEWSESDKEDMDWEEKEMAEDM